MTWTRLEKKENLKKNEKAWPKKKRIRRKIIRENGHKFLSFALDHPLTNKFTLFHHTGMVQALYV